MKTLLIRVAVAVPLGAGAWVCWAAGQFEGRVAEAHRQLATLVYQAPAEAHDEAWHSMSYVTRVPRLGEDMLTDLRRQRATALYWLANYATLELERDTAGAVVEKDPTLLFIAANAAYRTTEREPDERQAVMRKLEGVMATYVTVLKGSPAYVDAAYNYEYVARIHDLAARGSWAPSNVAAAAALSARSPKEATQVTSDGDLPAGPTIHGQPGGPPPARQMKQFHMFIPSAPDERRKNMQDSGGKSGRKIRKG